MTDLTQIPEDRESSNNHNINYENTDINAEDRESSNNSNTPMDSNEEDKQPVFIPQPPKIVSASVRYKRYKQLANRRNIATSPISTLNLEENESSFDLSREPTSPTNPVEPQKPNKSRRKNKNKRRLTI